MADVGKYFAYIAKIMLAISNYTVIFTKNKKKHLIKKCYLQFTVNGHWIHSLYIFLKNKNLPWKGGKLKMSKSK